MSDRRHDALNECYRLGREHGFVIANVDDCINPTSILARQFVRSYVLYRKHVRIGKRRDPAALLRLIKDTLAADKAPGAAP
jgi:hypothetical protein